MCEHTLLNKMEQVSEWSDLVLADKKIRQLRTICQLARHRNETIYGGSIGVLFSGPPGTGKTMAASIIARELSTDLYRIDLSMVVSKYIGETEKNLQRVFDAAESADAILFFDEADALFGKRTEVRDANDRYANIEISYLLQRIEKSKGLTILASNRKQHIDDAFLRRLQFIVEFPFPDSRQRRLIWESAFPEGTPLGEDVDFGMLSKMARLSGGSIRKIALAATSNAAENGDTAITMKHLIRAAKKEYETNGLPWDWP